MPEASMNPWDNPCSSATMIRREAVRSHGPMLAAAGSNLLIDEPETSIEGAGVSPKNLFGAISHHFQRKGVAKDASDFLRQLSSVSDLLRTARREEQP